MSGDRDSELILDLQSYLQALPAGTKEAAEANLDLFTSVNRFVRTKIPQEVALTKIEAQLVSSAVLHLITVVNLVEGLHAQEAS